MSTDSDIGPGRRVGNVLVERELGSGAYGIVYRARDTLLDRPVALKVLKPGGLFASAKERKRFLAEAKVVASLASPNVVTLFHVHVLGEAQWALELELVDGGTLADLLGEGARLPPETVVRIARELARGLAAAHDRGVVHGDVKPDNVLLSRDGTAKLADFGLARVVGERELERSGSTAAVGGTPFYMAPEVILGEGGVPASDVWSLGVVLYRMLSGRFPFAGATLYALFVAIQNEVPAPLDAGVPPRLAALVLRCLSKRPSDRATGGELEDLIAHALDAAAPPVSTPVRARPAAPRTPGVVGREREMATLDDVLRRVADGHGATLLVTGEAGIGKSAFLAEGAARAEARGFRWIRASIGESEGLIRPLFDSVRAALASEGRTDGEVDARRFGAAAPLLGALLSGSSPREIERPQVVWALHHLLHGLAREGPVALAVEGGQNAEPAEVTILRDLSRRTREARILLVVSARTAGSGPGLGSSGPPLPLADVDGVVRLDLAPLDDEALYGLIESTLDVRLSKEVAARVVGSAEGNPLFAMELLRHLEANEIVVRRGRDVVAGPAWSTVAIPARLVDLLSGRLRTLPAATRNLLDVAAVDGREFDGQAIAAVLDRDLLGVLRHLQKIARDEGLVVPQAQGYRFAHALLRDVVYEEVAPEFRRVLHRKLAEHLETRRDGVDPERIGVHWEAAGDPARAARHLREAAMRASHRAEKVRIVDLAVRGGLVPGRIPVSEARQEWELLMRLARALDTLGGHDAEVEAVYDVLLRVAEEDRDPLRQMRVFSRRGHFRYFGRGWQASDEADVRRAASLLPVSHDLGRARYLLGVIEKFRGNLDEATRWLLLADEAFRVVPASEQFHSSVLDQLASVALRAGRSEEAERRYAEAARVSESAGSAVNACASEVNVVIAALSRGVVEGHDERLGRAIRRLRLEQASSLAAHAMVVAAQIRIAMGELESALGILAEALAVLASSTNLPARAAVETESGYVQAALGRLDEADRALDRALEAAEKHEDASAQAHVWTYRAQVACLRGDAARADHDARRALHLVGSLAGTAASSAVLLGVLEAQLYGLDRAVLCDAVPAGALAGGGESPTARAADAWMGALRAAPGSPEEAAALRTTAMILRGDGIGPRRAILRVVADALAARAAVSGGSRQEGLAIAAAAHSRAGRMGHVALRATLARLLEEWCPDEAERRALLAQAPPAKSQRENPA